MVLNHRCRIAFFLISTAILLCFSPIAFAQTMTTADAVGTVSDSSGAVLPGAKVSLKSADSGETRTETANNKGEYRFALLKPGDYLISATATGLTSNTSKITLLVGQAQEVNVTSFQQAPAPSSKSARKLPFCRRKMPISKPALTPSKWNNFLWLAAISPPWP